MLVEFILSSSSKKSRPLSIFCKKLGFQHGKFENIIRLEENESSMPIGKCVEGDHFPVRCSGGNNHWGHLDWETTTGCSFGCIGNTETFGCSGKYWKQSGVQISCSGVEVENEKNKTTTSSSGTSRSSYCKIVKKYHDSEKPLHNTDRKTSEFFKPGKGQGTFGVLAGDTCLFAASLLGGVACKSAVPMRLEERLPAAFNGFCGNNEGCSFWGILGDYFYDQAGAANRNFMNRISDDTKNKSPNKCLFKPKNPGKNCSLAHLWRSPPVGSHSRKAPAT